MPVKVTCVVPHGAITVKELGYSFNSHQTITGFNEVRKICGDHGVNHFVVVDPHEKIYYQKFSFFGSDLYQGVLSNKGRVASRSFNGSNNINSKLLEVQGDIIRHSSASTHEIKWGSFVPLYHLNTDDHTINILSIDRKINERLIKDKSLELFNLLNSCSENICIIFSCDLSHCHSKTNPRFPFNENGMVYDNHVLNIIKENKIENYNQISRDVVNQANTDAHAQLTLLAGMCSRIRYRSKVFSYEVPSYFGMLTSVIEFDS
jgi:aromatic ring-opening dioxygenase LigB subunit